MDITEAQAAYAAGIFDGEGCVYIQKRNKSVTSRLHIEITNTNFEVINWLCTYFGGSITTYISRRQNERTCYKWHLTSISCKAFLKLIDPFVIIKRQQVEVALNFQEVVDRRGHRYGPRPSLSLVEIAIDRMLAEKLKSLKKA